LQYSGTRNGLGFSSTVGMAALLSPYGFKQPGIPRVLTPTPENT
jgi:hypothetical protein